LIGRRKSKKPFKTAGDGDAPGDGDDSGDGKGEISKRMSVLP
jgi:hypothetical protein